MKTLHNQKVFSFKRAGFLDNKLRKFLHKPKKILKSYVKDSSTVLDLGCGPGTFTIDMAKMTGNSGKVIAADLQTEMLEIVKNKVKGTELESRIVLQKCEIDLIGFKGNVDFVLAFYMVHEVPDSDKLFKEIYSFLNIDGKVLIVEPKFHVSKTDFDNMTIKLGNLGFEIISRPRVFFSRAVLVKK
jgi:ubiquinone/menaquinone biosynthesis C-methylase UbiE